MKPFLRVGSRGSPLALRQTELVMERLKGLRPEVSCELQVIKTTGDKLLTAPFTQMVGKGFFTKEIEEALLAQKIDFAVHSLKDLPTQLPTGLTLAAVLKREDPRDALISAGGKKLRELPRGARVGTSSPRRKMQLLAVRPDLEVVPLRGNLSTRLQKVLEPSPEETAEKLDAAVLALAGLKRMGLEKEVAELLSCDVMLPAVGQGFLGIEARAEDLPTLELLSALEDPASRSLAQAERSFLEAWGGGCSVPLGALAEMEGGRLKLRGVVFLEEKKQLVRQEVEGRVEEAVKLGKTLAERILA